MYEKDKLDEAQYFLNHLSQLPEPDSFRYELSAFLSAARSALQYALEEAKSKPGGQAWYDAQVSGRPLIRFFIDKRDVSIHEEPVRPATSVNVAITETLRISEAVHIRVTNAEGEVVQESHLSDPPSPVPPQSPPVVTYSYTFTDWTGNEGVEALCRLYLAEAQSIVSDGISRGYLTP